MKIGLIQLNSKLDPKQNLVKIKKYLNEAKEKQLEVICLPEVFWSMGDGKSVTPYLVEKNNDAYNEIKKMAQEFKIALIGGSVAYKEKDKILNRALNFDHLGNDLGVYDKNHLFKVDLNKTNLDEAKIYTAGKDLLDFKYKDFHFGISICFDLRFPELYREYFRKGVNIMTVASAFTVPTGKAHWEVLLRSRAIENQSYIVAANQVGEHNDKISTYGHSLIIDPWGNIMERIDNTEGLIYADLSIKLVKEVRSRMNVL